MLSLSDRIERYLKSNPQAWQNGGEIERLAMGIGYKASNASRRCREMVQDGTLERKEENGSVWYRIRQPQQTTFA